MIRFRLDENLLLLLLLKGKTAMDFIKPFSLHFLSFSVYVCVWMFVCEHNIGHNCVRVMVCVNMSKGMREFERNTNLP